MKKYMKTAVQGLFMMALALACVLQMELKVEAGLIIDAENGVQYEDEVEVGVGYVGTYAYGSSTYSFVDLEYSGDRVANIKSSSGNLLVKKITEDCNITTRKNSDTGEVTTTTEYQSVRIGYFAKKKGNYTVTFDVVKPDGTVRCTKSIKVKATGDFTYTSPFKSVTYAGKDIASYYPYTTRTSGKLKVKMKKGYQLVSIEVGKYNEKGSIEYKKVKNNKKITLAKKVVYSTEYRTSPADVTKQVTDRLFPYTGIKITCKEKKTGDKYTIYYSLYTMNKKQSW